MLQTSNDQPHQQEEPDAFPRSGFELQAEITFVSWHICTNVEMQVIRIGHMPVMLDETKKEAHIDLSYNYLRAPIATHHSAS